jgi:hypothetical protein
VRKKPPAQAVYVNERTDYGGAGAESQLDASTFSSSFAKVAKAGSFLEQSEGGGRSGSATLRQQGDNKAGRFLEIEEGAFPSLEGLTGGASSGSNSAAPGRCCNICPADLYANALLEIAEGGRFPSLGGLGGNLGGSLGGKLGGSLGGLGGASSSVSSSSGMIKANGCCNTCSADSLYPPLKSSSYREVRGGPFGSLPGETTPFDKKTPAAA